MKKVILPKAESGSEYIVQSNDSLWERSCRLFLFYMRYICIPIICRVRNPEVVYQLNFLYQVCIKSRNKKMLKEPIRYAKI